MRRAAWTMVCLGLLLLAARRQEQAPKSEQQPVKTGFDLEIVKREGYLKVLEGLRGKVVVVDIWGEF